MAGGRARQIIFRIFYSTSFTAVFILLIIFSAVTPADTIYESYKRNRLIDIFLIAGVYVFTALLAVLIYASRLYTNRSALKDIPKTFMPIEKEDLPGRRVHRLIQECLERSAVIAFQVRPRSKRLEHDTINAGVRMLALTKTKSSTDQTIEPSWGNIAHAGWSSPASKELPGLEYATVVDELVDLVEAKAVSLAPIDPLVEPGPDGSPLPNPRVIDEIARSGNMGMRAYLRYLIDIGVVPDDSLTVAFLAAYERARFSSVPLSDADFRALMRMFAELLRHMTPVEVDLLHLESDSEYGSGQHSHSQSDSSSLVERKVSHRSRHRDVETVSLPSTYSASGSVRHHKQPPRRVSEDSAPSLSSYELVHHAPSEAGTDGHDGDETGDADTQSLQTAPTTAPRSRSRPRPPLRSSTSRMYSVVSRLPSHPNDSGSLHSNTGSVVHHDVETQSSRSSGSLKSRVRKDRHNGRVLRLAREDEHGRGDSQHGLPYRIQIPQRESG
ncbi:thermatolerance membrane protein Dlt1 [Cladophialophora carrionii]|uniref:Defect at low temperature protein 1 n=1 Tax=Cladophialophora carrionii TaxID=86049 RepID=A0A1C1CHY6_9EURO|nr:thermatolerance membrane protein Dlt1 [Cladophialophora carrionii]